MLLLNKEYIEEMKAYKKMVYEIVGGLKMCPYCKIIDLEKRKMICEPKGDTCILCVLGNGKRFKEIEKNENAEYESFADKPDSIGNPFNR